MMRKQDLSTRTAAAMILFACILFSCPGQGNATDKVQLDILYMNHGPMRPTIANIKDMLGNYGDTVQASWHDVDQQSGESFMKKHNIVGHIPMLIIIDGQSDFNIDGRDIKLKGFPTGSSPFKRVEGNWSLEDLQLLLDNKLR